jgi:hypothetical protein
VRDAAVIELVANLRVGAARLNLRVDQIVLTAVAHSEAAESESYWPQTLIYGTPAASTESSPTAIEKL